MKKKYWFLILAILAASVIWNVYWNSRIVVHTYTHVTEEVPQAFDGFRIVQLTDLHSVRSEKQGQLVYDMICGQNPDVICVTGDLVDSRYYAKHGVEGEALTLALMEKLITLAHVYFIYGNHEMILLDDPQNNAFKNALEKLGFRLSIMNWFPTPRKRMENLFTSVAFRTHPRCIRIIDMRSCLITASAWKQCWMQ